MFLAWASPELNAFDVHVASYSPPFECHGGIKKKSPNLLVAFLKTQLSRSSLALWSPDSNQLRLFTATTLAPLRELPASPRHLFRRLTSSLFCTEKIIRAMFGWGNQRCLQRYVRHVALLGVRKSGHVTKHMALSYERSRSSSESSTGNCRSKGVFLLVLCFRNCMF